MGRELYNAALEAWRDNHRRWQQNPLRDRPRTSFYDNCKELTGLRAADDAWAGLSVQVGRGVLARLDRAVRRFYDGAGYPRFKGRDRWRSLEVAEASPSMIAAPAEGGRWHRLRVKGLPELRFDASRMDGELKQLRAAAWTSRADLASLTMVLRAWRCHRLCPVSWPAAAAACSARPIVGEASAHPRCTASARRRRRRSRRDAGVAPGSLQAGR